MTIFDFIRDLQNNAPPDRAGAWLRDNAAELPALSAAIQSNLTAPPEVVIVELAKQWPLAQIYYRNPQALNFIRALQAWLRDHPRC